MFESDASLGDELTRYVIDHYQRFCTETETLVLRRKRSSRRDSAVAVECQIRKGNDNHNFEYARMQDLGKHCTKASGN